MLVTSSDKVMTVLQQCPELEMEFKNIRDECSVTIYTHCAAHSLNICPLEAGQMPEVKKAVTYMNKTAMFFNERNKNTRYFAILY